MISGYSGSEMFNPLSLLRKKGAALLGMALCVLSLNVIIPSGYMIVPSASHVFAVVPCPSSNVLARHAASSAEHHEHVNHSAMGHHMPDQAERDGTPPDASQPDPDCAFSALSMAALLPGTVAPENSEFPVEFLDEARLPALAVSLPRYLRPPLRAPPVKG